MTLAFIFPRVKVSSEYGFINQKGETVVECKFDDIDDFGIYYPGWARVKNSSKYGFINQKGEIVVEVKYKKVKLYIGPENYILEVKSENNTVGFIDKKGKFYLSE